MQANGQMLFNPIWWMDFHCDAIDCVVFDRQFQDVEVSSIKLDFLCALRCTHTKKNCIGRENRHSRCIRTKKKVHATAANRFDKFAIIVFFFPFFLFSSSFSLFICSRVWSESRVLSCTHPLISSARAFNFDPCIVPQQTAYRFVFLIMILFFSRSNTMRANGECRQKSKREMSKLHSPWLASTKIGWIERRTRATNGADLFLYTKLRIKHLIRCSMEYGFAPLPLLS